MKFISTFFNLSNVTGGILSEGAILRTVIIRDEQFALGAGGVAVTAAGTQIATGTMPSDVQLGDRLYVFGGAGMTKGGVAGLCNAALRQVGGTATIVSQMGTGNPLVEMPAIPAAGVWRVHLFGIYAVTAPGTLDMEIFAQSAGSNSTTIAGACGFHMWCFRGE